MMKKLIQILCCISIVACACEKSEKIQRVGGIGEPVPEYSGEEILKGGDISFLTLIEQKGGKFKTGGQEKDCVKLLAEAGFNIVRLRLFNDPGNKAYDPSRKMYPGIQDEADILDLARRAKAEGLQIQLTFHYSDYWTNGEDQYKPHDWVGLSYPTMKTAVYEYTKSFLQKMKDQNTAPEYVSLGNEIQAGLLYPDGAVTTSTKQTAELMNAGAKAVREVLPDAKVVIHLAGAGDVEGFKWFFKEMKDHALDYDVIGASYYPYWTEKSIEEISAWATTIGSMFAKPILLMETGFAWTEKCYGGLEPQISHNHPYGISKEEQKTFMENLFKAIAANPWLIGDLYWDPIFIPAGDAGWIPGGPNIVSNSTLFDFEGNALPALEVYSKQYKQK